MFRQWAGPSHMPLTLITGSPDSAALSGNALIDIFARDRRIMSLRRVLRVQAAYHDCTNEAQEW
jgi:hypothetical protein